MCTIQVIRQGGQAAGLTKAIKLLRRTKNSSTNACIDSSFPSVIKAALNYNEVSEMQLEVLFAEARIKNILDGVIPS